jgi:hypothetical protein
MRHPKALGGATRSLPAVLAFNAARSIGRRLDATTVELRDFMVPIASGATTYEDVRAWFAARLVIA